MSTDDIENGSIWVCKSPQCWTIVVQYVDGDRYLLLSGPDANGRMHAHSTTEYGVNLSREQVCAWLNRMQAKRMDSRLTREALDAPDIADELATALRMAEHRYRSMWFSIDDQKPVSNCRGEWERMKSVLRRYDDSRKEHA